MEYLSSILGNNPVVIDIEADGLLHEFRNLHVIGVSSLYKSADEETTLFLKDDLLKHFDHLTPTLNQQFLSLSLTHFQSTLDKCTAIIGHNIIGFDIPLLKKLGYTIPDSTALIDTYLLSQMMHPDRTAHSLESWAAEFGYQKVQNEDWSVLTENMLQRNIIDVEITSQLAKKLLDFDKTMVDVSKGRVGFKQAYLTECYVYKEVSLQSQRGCPYNERLLTSHIDKLRLSINSIYSNVEKILGNYIVKGTEVSAPFTKTGKLTSRVASYIPNELHDHVMGAFTKVDILPVKLSQHGRVKELLLSFGWKPTAFTETGEPKLPKGDEWEKIAESTASPELSQLALYGSLSNRLSILEGLASKRINGTSRLDYGAATCGTPTGRFRHHTIVNIPRASWKDGKPIYFPDKQSSVFGTEMREIFGCPYDGFKQVGIDLSGIELRVLAHMINNKDFTDVILSGDIHSLLWGNVKHLVASRNDHKSVLYGLMYGAGDQKLANLATALPVDKRTPTVGKVLRHNIENTIPNFGKVIEQVKISSLRGYLIGLDKRPVFCSEGSRTSIEKIGSTTYKNPLKITTKDSLNRFIQSSAAILFKKWIEIAIHDLNSAKIEYETFIFYHDEIQSFVAEGDVERYIEIVLKAINKTKEYFNYNIRLDGEYKVGMNWSECH